MDDGAFRVPGDRMARQAALKRPPSGRVLQAVSFGKCESIEAMNISLWFSVASGGKAFMAIGCSSGIFVGRKGESKYLSTPFLPYDRLIIVARLS